MAYTRYFMPLESEATGYDFKGRTPAGRCVVEDRDGMVKISVWAQDIRTETRFSVYMIFPKDGRYAGVHICNLNVDTKGKAEIRKDVDRAILEGYNINELTAVAVMVSDISKAVISPLCGYRDRPVSWRSGFHVPTKATKEKEVKKESAKKIEKEPTKPPPEKPKEKPPEKEITVVLEPVKVSTPTPPPKPEPPPPPEPKPEPIAEETTEAVEVKKEPIPEPLQKTEPVTAEEPPRLEPEPIVIKEPPPLEPEPIVIEKLSSPQPEPVTIEKQPLEPEPIAIKEPAPKPEPIPSPPPELAPVAIESLPSPPAPEPVTIEKPPSLEPAPIEPAKIEEPAPPPTPETIAVATEEPTPPQKPTPVAPEPIVEEKPAPSPKSKPTPTSKPKSKPATTESPPPPKPKPEPKPEPQPKQKTSPPPKPKPEPLTIEPELKFIPEPPIELPPAPAPPSPPPEPKPTPPPRQSAPKASKPKGAKPISRKTIAEEFREALQDLNHQTVAHSPSRTEDMEAIISIFASKEPIYPFVKQTRETKWVQLSESDTVPLPHNRPNLLQEPFVLSAYTTHGHIILGLCEETTQYIIGLPGEFAPDIRSKVKRLGFTQFKTNANDSPKRGDSGYWLMFINM